MGAGLKGTKINRESEGLDIARVAIVACDAALVRDEYNALVRAVRGFGHQVRCFVTSVTRDVAADLDAQGVFCTEFSLVPDRFAVFPQRRAIGDLADLLGEWKPTVVIAVGGKELVYGAIAARKARVGRVIAVVETLPAPADAKLSDEDARPSAREFRRALRRVSEVVCLNAGTPRVLDEALGVLGADTNVSVVPRCGVDLDTFGVRDVPADGAGLVFHLSCPLEADNNVLAYCQAAAQLKSEAPGTEFLLSGASGKSDNAISLEMLEPFANIVDYVGLRSPDVDELAKCHVFVNLARDESLPLCVMQALAIGRPLIVANTPSGRELVDERVNGCLVDPENVDDIAGAMRSYLRQRELVACMARASRQKAERRLDQRAAVAKLLPLLELVP